MWANFSRINLGTTFKGRKNLYLKIRHFQVAVVQHNKEMYKISVMHVQSCCSAQHIYYFFDILVSVTDVVA